MSIHPYITHRIYVLETEERDRAIERRRVALERAQQIVPREPGRVTSVWAFVTRRGSRAARRSAPASR